MPLTSFQEAPQPVAPLSELNFRLGAPDISEAAGVADQAMYELGLAGSDREKNLEEITVDFTALAKLGYDGRLHVLPSATVTFDHALATAENKRPKGVKSVWKYDNLWTPGTEKQSYSEADLNRGPRAHVARLAVFSSLETGYDAVLHDLGKPYDSYKDKNLDVNPDGVPTQLEGLEADRTTLESSHEGYILNALDHKAFAVLALMDRIRGVKTEDQILARGFMPIPDLGRRSVDGVSIVGYVNSSDGRLGFSGGDGGADSGGGVGRSMGLNEA